jgi:hypothetical protein
MMSHKSIILVLTAAATLPGQRAFGADHVPASTCRLSFNTTGPVNYFDGEIYNSSDTTQFVDCPSRRNRCFVLQAYYVDTSPAANFRCYGYSYLPDGTTFFGASRFSCITPGGCIENDDPSFASTEQNYLEFPEKACFQGVTCELPPGGTIRFIRRVF